MIKHVFDSLRDGIVLDGFEVGNHCPTGYWLLVTGSYDLYDSGVLNVDADRRIGKGVRSAHQVDVPPNETPFKNQVRINCSY